MVGEWIAQQWAYTYEFLEIPGLIIVGSIAYAVFRVRAISQNMTSSFKNKISILVMMFVLFIIAIPYWDKLSTWLRETTRYEVPISYLQANLSEALDYAEDRRTALFGYILAVGATISVLSGVRHFVYILRGLYKLDNNQPKLDEFRSNIPDVELTSINMANNYFNLGVKVYRCGLGHAIKHKEVYRLKQFETQLLILCNQNPKKGGTHVCKHRSSSTA